MARLSAVWKGRVSPQSVSGSDMVCGPGSSLLAFMWVWGGEAGEEALRLLCRTRHCLSLPGGVKGVDPAVPGRADPPSFQPLGHFCVPLSSLNFVLLAKWV